jgi:hypothetical protein
VSCKACPQLLITEVSEVIVQDMNQLAKTQLQNLTLFTIE